MAGSNGRAKRHFFGGTGLYIALFLGVTALAVAGYWTLLPKNTTDKDAENVSSQVELPVQDETPQMPEAELPPEAVDGLEACVKEHGAALITGALTDTMVLPLLRSGVLRNCRLVVKDPSKVLLTADTLDKLATRSVTLETEEAARTLCITVNPVSAYGWKFDKDDFLHRMREAVDVPVINVKEELA